MKQRLALKARVKRDGAWKDVEARLLVPGDVVLVGLGNIVPADMKLVEGDYLSVDQSALTGESLPVDKKVGDEAYSGSIAKQGQMTGLVTATGMNTYFGKTAHLVEQAKTVSHFQRAVLKIGNFLILTTVGLVLLIGVAALFRHDPLLETLQFALILTVASIPVALPAVLSVTMAVGAEKLARMKAIVSRLVVHRGNGGHGHPVQRQDRHADQEPADPRRGPAGARRDARRADARRRARLAPRRARRHRRRDPRRRTPDAEARLLRRARVPAVRSGGEAGGGGRRGERRRASPSPRARRR